MIYRLLGELEVGPEGDPAQLPGGPALIILAALLLNANRRLSKASLIRAAWGGAEVQEAQLHKRIMAVREVLAGFGRREDLRTHARFGYELRIATRDADLLIFQHLIRLAEEAGTGGRPAEEVAALREALLLWRGPRPLSNVPGGAFRREIAALEQRHKRAAARLFELEIAAAHDEGILDELIQVAGFYPSDRRLCELLMIAASRCGHATDAAAAYDRHAEALAEEAGAEPDSLLRDLHFAIARSDDMALAAAQLAITRRAGLTARPPAAVPRQLPRAETVIGRGDLAGQVAALLAGPGGPAPSAVVISGPGGIGKTALAVRAAHEAADRFPDGQLFAELRGTSGASADTGEVLAQFLRALGVPAVPESRDERLAQYRTLLADSRMLIMLDDAADADQVNDLLPAGPGCAALVTARQRLPGVSGSHHVAPLEPLRDDSAAELFRSAVREAGIVLERDGDDAAIADVVALCGGLPLALRIAAALRVHYHPRTTAELAGRLASQGPATALAYGRLSVARTMGAGLDRLSPQAAQLFLALGLLPLTEFGLWTAAALAGEDAAAALSELTASFLLEPAWSGQRYRFHDLTREYARLRALADYRGDREAAPVAVYRALLTLARRAHACLYGGDFEVVHSEAEDWAADPAALAEVEAGPLAWFERERRNIRVAVQACADLGLTQVCWDLAVSAHEFYTIRGYHDDWLATHTVALDACRKAGDERGEGILLACLSQPALVASQRPAGGGRDLSDLRRAVGLLAGCGDRHGQAIALRTLANAMRRLGHLGQPLEQFLEALEHYTASGDTVGRWQTLRFIGQTYLDLGDDRAAVHVLEEAYEVARELGGERLIAQTRYWTGMARLAAGDLGGAQAEFDGVLAAFPEDLGVGHAYARHGLGEAALSRGALAAAGEHLGRAVTLAREGADAVLEGRALLSIAALRRAEGGASAQAEALREAAAVFAACGAAYLEARALAGLARLLAGCGEDAAAAAAWRRMDQLYDSAGVPAADRVARG